MQCSRHLLLLLLLVLACLFAYPMLTSALIGMLRTHCSGETRFALHVLSSPNVEKRCHQQHLIIIAINISVSIATVYIAIAITITTTATTTTVIITACL